MASWLTLTLKIAGIILMVAFIGILWLVFLTGPTLPDETDDIVEDVIHSDLPEFVNGQTGYVMSDSCRIWYEVITPEGPAKGSVLLFMGISNDALAWPQGFLDRIASHGYRVIRFDYRGTGLSDWNSKGYSLSDLAADAVLILDSLDIRKAHLLGISLGGMVAQEYAVHYPDRTSTLTSVMSSGYITDPEMPGISKKFVLTLIANNIRYSIIPSEKNTLKRSIAVRMLLRGDADYDIDIRSIAQQVLYNIRERKGFNPRVSQQQQKATMRSGSRHGELKNIAVPTLVVHGLDDPFIPPEHSRKLASVIPGADTLWIENMGHDLPPYLTDSLIEILIGHFARAEGEVER